MLGFHRNILDLLKAILIQITKILQVLYIYQVCLLNYFGVHVRDLIFFYFRKWNIKKLYLQDCFFAHVYTYLRSITKILLE